MGRHLLALGLAGMIVYGVFFQDKNLGPGPDIDPTPATDVAGLAEAVHRDRAANQAAVYRTLAELLRSGQIVDSYQLGDELTKRIAGIEAAVTADFKSQAVAVFDADTRLEPGDTAGRDAWRKRSAAWMDEAANGYDKVTK